MDEHAIVAAIRRAGYVPYVHCRDFHPGQIEVWLCNGTAPKIKWFGVLQRKLARQGIRIIGYNGGQFAYSQYIESLQIPCEPDTPDA